MSQEKNLLFFLYRYPFVGGIESVTTVLANYMADAGYRVHILSFEKEDSVKPDLSPEIKISTLPEERDLRIDFFNRYLAENGIDVILNQGCFQELSDVLFNDRLPAKCRIVSALHGIPMHEVLWASQNQREKIIRKRRGIMRYYKLAINHLRLNKHCRKTKKNALINQKRVYELSQEVVLLTSLYEQEYRRKYRIADSGKLTVIPNPTAFADLSGGIDAATVAAQKEILYVGRLSRSDKRVDRLIRIWSKIWKRNPEWKLRIIGDGPDKESLMRLSSRYGAGNILFEGYKNPAGFFANASVICLTSQMEGYPVALTEGICMGLVPIAFDCSEGIRDLLQGGKSGILIKPFDLNRYASELEKLMKDEALREAYARACLENSTRFRIRTIGAEWEKLLFGACH